MPKRSEFEAIARFLDVSRAQAIELAFGVTETTEDRLTRLEGAVDEIRALLQGMTQGAGEVQSDKP